MARTVEQACQDFLSHEKYRSGCNLFVIAVVQEFVSGAVHAADNADAIIKKMHGAPFVWIGTNPDEATKQAAAGNVVLGGLTKAQMTYTTKSGQHRVATMGHVVVVVEGGPSRPGEVTLASKVKQAVRGGYPYCYQGAAASAYRFEDRTQVDAVFPGPLLDKVIYAYLPIASAR